jgi:hypothetical protein
MINRTLAALDWSPDSSAVLFETGTWDVDCRDTDYLGGTYSTLALSGGRPKAVVQLATAGDNRGAGWSTNGRSIAFTADCWSICNLFRVPSMGGRPRPLTAFRSPTSPFYDGTSPDGLPFAWSHAGNQVLYGRQRSLFSVEASTGVTRRVATTPCPAQRSCRRSEVFIDAQSPEGDVIAYSTTAWTPNVDVDSEQLDVTTSDGATRWSVPYPRATRRGAELSGYAVFLD